MGNFKRGDRVQVHGYTGSYEQFNGALGYVVAEETDICWPLVALDLFPETKNGMELNTVRLRLVKPAFVGLNRRKHVQRG